MEKRKTEIKEKKILIWLSFPYSCKHGSQVHMHSESRLLWQLDSSKWKGSVFIVVASEVVRCFTEQNNMYSPSQSNQPGKKQNEESKGIRQLQSTESVG